MLQIIHISDLHLTAPGSGAALKAWLANKFPPVAHFYSVAKPYIRYGLRRDLKNIALLSPTPIVLALTGDITAWPYDTDQKIERYYDYIEELISFLPIGSILLPVLGNHDWIDDYTTGFSSTRFQQVYRITEPRYIPFDVDGIKAIFFLIDSNNGFTPAAGLVDGNTLTWLERSFQDGQQGRLKRISPGGLEERISPEDYNGAVKIVLLHHPPLPVSAYGGAFLPFDYKKHVELVNAQNLVKVCGGNIDMFLFGHTHIPTGQAFDGFVMINAGPTLAIPPPTSWFLPNFQMIRILDRDAIEVQTFYWVMGRFSSLGCKPITFRRGVDAGAIGRGGWA
jgi:3',5'-cyclic AMP phosphodiesterase CpdA